MSRPINSSDDNLDIDNNTSVEKSQNEELYQIEKQTKNMNQTENQGETLNQTENQNEDFDAIWNTLEKEHQEKGISQRKPKKRKHHSRTDNNLNPFQSSKKKWSFKKKFFVGVPVFLLCLILIFTGTFFYLRYVGKNNLLEYSKLNMNLPKQVGYLDDGHTITYNGHTYRFNDNIATILFIGVDNRELSENAVAGTGGQADALYLLTYDTSTGVIRVVSINRDTIADISRYDEAGVYYDTNKEQICMAYAFGDGKELSAKNQVTSVSRLLYNAPINAYYAIDLSAIKILNDDIGGVTVTPEADFREFKAGVPVTLQGDMAEAYVRSRDFEPVDANVNRMSRQKQYITAFASQISQAIRDDFTVPVKLYNDSKDYTVTNLGLSDITYLGSSLATTYSGIEYVSIDGKYKDSQGDESARFIPNNDSLLKTVLDIYYTQID